MSIAKKQLLVLMGKTDNYRPVSEYAKKLEVSSRTIYSYLNEIELQVNSFNCSIKKVPGKGVLLKGELSDQQKLLESIDKEKYKIDLSPEERRRDLLNRMLKKEVISYAQLSEDYFVSRATIVNDIKSIKSNYKIQENELTHTHQGTELNTTEYRQQLIWASWLADNFESTFGYLPTDLNIYMKFSSKLFPQFKEIIQVVGKQVTELSRKHHLQEYYAVKIFEKVIILTFRASQGYHLEPKEESVFEVMEHLDIYYLADEFIKVLSSDLELTYSTEDIIFTHECFIANGLEESTSIEESKYYEKIVDKLIEKFSTVLDMDLTSDEKLKRGLLSHLIPMYFRIQQNLHLPNPYIREIKRQYSIMFHLTWILLVDLEQELKKRIPEEEIGFMMVHFQSALERNRDAKKILIVSQAGVLTSELLEIRIKKALPSIHAFELVSEKELKNFNLEKVDLILSTIDIPEQATEVFRLSMIPTEKELRTISSYITENLTEKTNKHLGTQGISPNSTLKNFIRKEDIVNKKTLQSPDEVIKYLVEKLELRGVVDKRYLESVLDREQLSTTAFETGVAIPHGNPEFVNETSISVYISDEKISWGKEKINIVLLFSVAKKDIEHLRAIIEPIYEVIDTREKVERIFIKQTSEEIIRYFSKF